jgi:hypothetical protein
MPPPVPDEQATGIDAGRMANGGPGRDGRKRAEHLGVMRAEAVHGPRTDLRGPPRPGDDAQNAGTVDEGVVKELEAAGVQPHRARKAAEVARDVELEPEVRQVLGRGEDGVTRIEHPAGLPNFLEKVSAEEREGIYGHRRELEYAAERSRFGRVALGWSQLARAADGKYGRADVIDHGVREAVQMKSVVSRSDKEVVEDIRTGALQLSGRKKEFPPVGYARIVHVVIENGDNPLHQADAGTIQERLRLDLDGTDLAGVGEIRVVNARGRHVLTPSDLLGPPGSTEVR